MDEAASVKLTTKNLTDIYTVPAATTSKLPGGIIISSLDSDPVQVTVSRYQAADASTHELASITLSDGGSEVVAVDLVLEAGDKIKAQAGRANAADVTVGAEEDDGTSDTDTYSADAPAVAQAADDENAVAEITVAGAVSEVAYIPKVAIVGADTDSRTVQLVNETQAGVVVAEYDFTNGHNAAQFAEKDITLSATPQHLQVAEGDILTWKSTHVGAGLADPGGEVTVTVTPS